jgi:hypothetical protein
MFSNLMMLLTGSSIAESEVAISAIQAWQGLSHNIYDRCFVNGAQYKGVVQILNELATSNLVLEIELNEFNRLLPVLGAEDVPSRMEWVRQDTRRVWGCLKFLRERLILIEEPWAPPLTAEIERLLE